MVLQWYWLYRTDPCVPMDSEVFHADFQNRIGVLKTHRKWFFKSIEFNGQ